MLNIVRKDKTSRNNEQKFVPLYNIAIFPAKIMPRKYGGFL